MKIKRIVFIVLIAFSYYSCSTDDDLENVNEPSNLSFKTTVENLGSGGGSAPSWKENDKIGVFMKEHNQILSSASILDNAENKLYMTSGNGIFLSAPSSEAIKMPLNGRKVDFIAYHPYTQSISNFMYPIDIKDQDIQADIDLLYSNQATGKDKNNPDVTLNFKHTLSKLIFNINGDKTIPSLNGLTAKIAGLKTKATFHLADAQIDVNDTSIADIELKSRYAGAGIIIEAIVIPDDNLNGVVVTFILPDYGMFKLRIPDNTKYETGKRYIYNVQLKGEDNTVYLKSSSTIEDWDSETPIDLNVEKEEGGEVDNYGWLETPTRTSISNTTFVNHMLPFDSNAPQRSIYRNYSMLYDTQYKLAHWVAYPMHSFYLGSTKRTDKWAFDPAVDQAYQPYLFSSWGITGMDRGHQLPSADRTYSVAENETTFYFTNMAVQQSTLNQTTWANLESKLRTWTGQCDTLYVVTGASITTKDDTNIEIIYDRDNRSVAKPKFFYKAIAKREGDMYYTIAYKMNNVATSDSYDNYRLTVAQLENETGFEFFPSIPSVSKKIINSDKWK
ncbi:MAG: fimbrillin family protein [Dysgonomonas sp.]|nr:fimbrillin family protein [Dysgonomonas sp.]